MAVTMTNPNSGDITYFSIPIAKTENTAEINPVDGTPDLVIWGKATDGTVDGDLQIVDPEWSGPALRKWLETGGNVRASHDPHQEVGRGLEVELTEDGHWVKSLIVDPVAKHKIRNKVLNDYSVGITFPLLDRDPMGKALNGIIRGNEHTQICELSVVGRGSNYNSRFQLLKSAANGNAQLVGKMIEGDPLVASAQKASTVTVELPADFKMKFSPKDLARLVNGRTPKAEKRDFDRGVGEHGVDRDTLDTSDFADPANRKYPIVVPKDAHDAWILAGHAGDPEAVRKRIRSIAHRKGPSFVAALPDTAQGEEKKEKTHGAVEAQAGSGADQSARDRAGAAQDDPGHVDKAVQDVSAGGEHRTHPDEDVLGKQREHDAGELRLSEKSSDDDDKGRIHAAENFDSDAQDTDDGNVNAEEAPDDESEGDSDGYAAPARTKKVKKKNKKGKGKKAMKALEPDLAKEAGRTQPTPGDGVVGAHTEPVAAHREPDGAAIEAFEADAKLPTDPDSEYKTIRHYREIGVSDALGELHDQFCSAFHPQAVKAAHPFLERGTFDITPWQHAATEAWAMSSVADAEKADALLADVMLIKGCHPAQLEQMQGELFKSFRDANTGPASFPTPHDPMAGQFKRPAVTAGRARLSHQYEGPNTAHTSFENVAPNDFDRGFLSDGRSTDSPANTHEARPVSPPDRPGRPTRVFYTGAQRDNAKQAMRAMHDHVARMFPDLCPMSPHDADLTDVPSPNHGVSAVGLPAAKGEPLDVKELAVKISGSFMSVDEIQELLAANFKGAKGGKKGKKKGKLPAFLQEKIDAKNGKDGDGKDMDEKKDGAEKAVEAQIPETPVETGTVEKAAVAQSPDLELLLKTAMPEMITKAVTAATAELGAQLGTVTKALKQQKRRNKELASQLASLESQDDPNFGYYRGVGAMPASLAKSATARDAAPSAASIRDGAELNALQMLNQEYLEAYDPRGREAALGKIYQMTGIRR